MTNWLIAFLYLTNRQKNSIVFILTDNIIDVKMLTLVEPQLVEDTGNESRQKSVKMREKSNLLHFMLRELSVFAQSFVLCSQIMTE